VAHHVLHDFQFHPGGQREGGSAVSKVVQPDRGQPGFFGQGPEVAGEPVRGERVAAEAGEDVAAVVVAGLLLFGAALASIPCSPNTRQVV
jgi:hypothetical protein